MQYNVKFYNDASDTPAHYARLAKKDDTYYIRGRINLFQLLALLWAMAKEFHLDIPHQLYVVRKYEDNTIKRIVVDDTGLDLGEVKEESDLISGSYFGLWQAAIDKSGDLGEIRQSMACSDEDTMVIEPWTCSIERDGHTVESELLEVAAYTIERGACSLGQVAAQMLAIKNKVGNYRFGGRSAQFAMSEQMKDIMDSAQSWFYRHGDGSDPMKSLLEWASKVISDQEILQTSERMILEYRENPEAARHVIDSVSGVQTAGSFSQKIERIKAVRAMSSLGLLESKQLVEYLWNDDGERTLLAVNREEEEDDCPF